MVRTRRLIFALIAALLIAGCATQPATPFPGHQDPEIWRPQKPVYPMPQ